MKRAFALKWVLAGGMAILPYVLLSFQAGKPSSVSFQKQVMPLLKKQCVACHSGPQSPGKLDLTTASGVVKGGESGLLVVGGSPDKSLLWARLNGHNSAIMPPGGKLPEVELRVFRQWIQEGGKIDTPMISYAKEIAPIFKAYCSSCHFGPEAKAGLDFGNPVWVTSRLVDVAKPENSLLLQRVTGKGGMPQMPLGFKPLSAENIEKIRAWIASGAETGPDQEPEHWAYVPPKKMAPPAKGNPIDAFIRAKLKSSGLKPSKPADRATLVRRLYLDLTGLPPTPAQVDAFIAEKAPGAYERLVESLLKDPAHGERMARMWLDLARYADSQGFEADRNRVMWRYRDWVINAFNRNMPYDQFSKEQLAGDLLPNPTLDQLIATGFHRNTMMNEEGGVDPGEQHYDVVMDRANTTSSVWLGSTMACARCHDHKFDPISQKDYYAMVAYFDNSDYQKLGDPQVGQEKWYEPQIDAPTPDIAPKQREVEAQVQEARRALDRALESPTVEAEFAEWLREESKSRRSPRMFAITSPHGESFRMLTDDSISVEGNNPKQTRYSLSFNLPPDATGLRIEALPDARLKGGGSGRSSGGNFLLTGVELRGVLSKLPGYRVGVDFTQSGYTPADALKMQKGDVGWAVYPRANQPHEMVLEFESALPNEETRKSLEVGATLLKEGERPSSPLPPSPPQGGSLIRALIPGGLLDTRRFDGISVELILAFESPWEQHGFGRFRISPTFEPNPISRILSAETKAILANPNRSAEHVATLKRAFAGTSKSLKPALEQVQGLEAKLADLKRNVPKALIMRDKSGTKSLTTHLRNRGEFLNLGEVVEAAPPPFLKLKKSSREDRSTLAAWLFSRENPLTARVQVNRLWELFFGEGLVHTMEDFGTQGERPSHPELLDWLAVEFMDRGWDNQAIMKLIVTSETYKQAAISNKAGLTKDPENKLLWRGPRFRMEAEMVRDSMLSIGGVLNAKLGGPSVYPDQPPGIWDTPYNGEQWMPSESHDRFRRSLYTFWKRSSTFPMFMAFDATSREVCTARRIRTNTPLQALALMNDVAMMEAARGLATLMLKEGGPGEADKLNYGFKRCTSRLPNPKELARLTNLMTSLRRQMAINPDSAKIDKNPEVAVWIMAANTLLNLDETITKG